MIRAFVKPILSAVATLILACMFAHVVFAAGDPDPNSNPLLASFIKSGARIFYMGVNSGLQGWFIIKDNEVQIAYTTPGNESAVVGVLLDPQGNNVTEQQMKTLYQTNKEVNSLVTEMGNRMQSMLPQTSFGQASPAGGVPGIPASSLGLGASPVPSPGEQLMQALQGAAGVDVGAPSAPKLTMIIDPNCPHCHETWQAMRTAVFGGKLQIRLVPIGAFGPDSVRAAAQLLHASDPLNAWDKYVGGDKSQLAGSPDDATIKAVNDNHALTDTWHIQMTPYLVYRAKDGQVKIVQGEPDHPDTVISDIGP